MEAIINSGIIAIYLAVVIGVGFLFNNKKETAENYLLGGRNMPVFAIGLSCLMSLLSSISIVNIPGEIFNHGLTLFIFSILNLLLQIPAYYVFTRFYFKLGSYTPFEYLEYRYDKNIRALVAISSFYARTLYIGMVLYTTAKIFEGAYNWPAWFSITLIGVIGVVYTVMGGMKAVVWTDVIQFFVLGLGFIIIIIVLCANLDCGALGAIKYGFAHGHGIPQLQDGDFFKITPYVRLMFFLMLFNNIIAPFQNACSDQIMIQRFLATKDWKAGGRANIINTLLGITSTLVLFFIGFAIFAYYSQNPDPIVTEKGGDIAFFRFISTKLPTPLPGLFMAAMLAAIMSTLDSGINSMATVWLKEIHSKFINRNMTDEQEVKVSRWGTFIIGVIAVALGLGINFSGRWLSQSVAEVGTIFAILGAGTFPAFILAAFSKRTNSALIWCYTIFSFGGTLGMTGWYIASRTAEQAWFKDPTMTFGLAGQLPLNALLIPLFAGLILLLPKIISKTRHSLFSNILFALSLICMGLTLAMIQWYGFSNWLITDLPLSRSFAYNLPLSLIGVLFVVKFCKVQPEHKWKGLTLGTINQQIISAPANASQEHRPVDKPLANKLCTACIALCLLLSFALIGIQRATADPQPPPAEALAAADRAYSSGNYREAVQFYRLSVRDTDASNKKHSMLRLAELYKNNLGVTPHKDNEKAAAALKEAADKLHP
jgi:SSS family transporter